MPSGMDGMSEMGRVGIGMGGMNEMGNRMNGMGGMHDINNMDITGMSAMGGRGGMGGQISVSVVRLLTRQATQILVPPSVVPGILEDCV